MAKRVSAFYAYPFKPESQVETIEAATKEISKSGKIKIKPWTRLSIVGRPVIGQITEAIDRASIFACDLTFTNAHLLMLTWYLNWGMQLVDSSLSGYP